MEKGGGVKSLLLDSCIYGGILAHFRAYRCVRDFLSYRLWSLYISASTEKSEWLPRMDSNHE